MSVSSEVVIMTTSDEIAKLVRRLRGRCEGDRFANTDYGSVDAYCHKAADALEQQARELVIAWHAEAIERERSVHLAREIAELRERVVEECARIVERWSLPTIQAPSMWLVDQAGIAAEIRALKPAPQEPQRNDL
jgi:hypothetical protein